MTKRFTTSGYKIYDTFHDGMHWLVNKVEAEEIVEVMNNLDLKARERSKALSKLQKENEQLKFQLDECRNHKLFSRRQLEEENTRLKKERNHFERKKTEYLTEWNTCRIQNTELKKDNQELKEAMKRMMIEMMGG